MSGEKVTLCSASASHCLCSKPEGHAEPEHACTDDGCLGIWRGDYHADDDSFVIVRSPLGRVFA